MEKRTVDDSFAEISDFGTANLRSIESSRANRLFNDPFAELLTRNNPEILQKRLPATSEQGNSWLDLVAIRTRYVNEALEHRDSSIHQVVIFGAGLDSRAYYMEALRGCHVLELDQSSKPFDRKKEVMETEKIVPIAKKLDYIVANLADDDWDSKLREHGFDPSLPTFWVMEGLLPYMQRPEILSLLDTMDAMSAPCSTFWADTIGSATFNFGDVGDRTMKYSEEDPIHGVLSQIPWCLKLQASLTMPGTHFGRQWVPLVSKDKKTKVPLSFVIGQKPTPTDTCEKDMCPGLVE